jgi:hypothetical protein
VVKRGAITDQDRKHNLCGLKIRGRDDERISKDETKTFKGSMMCDRRWDDDRIKGEARQEEVNAALER